MYNLQLTVTQATFAEAWLPGVWATLAGPFLFLASVWLVWLGWLGLGEAGLWLGGAGLWLGTVVCGWAWLDCG